MTDQRSPEGAQGHEPNPEEESATVAQNRGENHGAIAPEGARAGQETIADDAADDEVDAGETADATVWRPVTARPTAAAGRNAGRADSEEPTADGVGDQHVTADPDASASDPSASDPSASETGAPAAASSPHEDQPASADGAASADSFQLFYEAPPATDETHEPLPWPIPPGGQLPGDTGFPDLVELLGTSEVFGAETSERGASSEAVDHAVSAPEAEHEAESDSAPEADSEPDTAPTDAETPGDTAAEGDLFRLGTVADPVTAPEAVRAASPWPLPPGDRVAAEAEASEQIERTTFAPAIGSEDEAVADADAAPTGDVAPHEADAHEGAAQETPVAAEVPGAHDESAAREEPIAPEVSSAGDETGAVSADARSDAGDDDDPFGLLPGTSEPDAAAAAPSAWPLPPGERVADDSELPDLIEHTTIPPAGGSADEPAVESTDIEEIDAEAPAVEAVGAAPEPEAVVEIPAEAQAAAEAEAEAGAEAAAESGEEPVRRDPSRRSLREKHRAERRAAREAAVAASAATAAAAAQASTAPETSAEPSEEPQDATATAEAESGDRWWKPLLSPEEEATSPDEETTAGELPTQEPEAPHAPERQPEDVREDHPEERHGLGTPTSDERPEAERVEETSPDLESAAGLAEPDVEPEAPVTAPTGEAQPEATLTEGAQPEAAHVEAPSPRTLDIPQVTPAQIAAEALPPVPDSAPTRAPGAFEAPAPFEAPFELPAAPPPVEEDAASTARRNRRRRRGIVGLVAAGLAVVLAGYAAADATDLVPGVLTTDPPRPDPVAFPHPTPAVDGEGTGFPPVDADAPIPDPAAIAAIFDGAFDEEVVGNISIDVQDAFTGEELHTQDAEQPRTPASVTKVLTAAAGLSELGADSRLATTALLDGETVVLRGGGDVLLGTGESDPGAIDGRAGLKTLGLQAAEQLRSKGITRVTVVRDESLYTGAGLHDTWEPSDVGNGFVAPISPLMVSAGRTDPTSNASRTNTPGLFATEAFAEALEAGGIEVVDDTGEAGTPEGAEQLAEVRSAPISSIVDFLLVHSDNVVSEAMGRQVALARGEEPDFAGAASAVEGALVDLGLDRGEISLTDLSGLSYDNQISPADVATLFSSAVQDGGSMAALPASLPVAGWSGTLSNRFGTEGAEAGAGVVRAKTGTLRSVASLAGTLVTDDGRLLTFAIMADGLEPADAAGVRRDVDVALAEVVECGCSG